MALEEGDSDPFFDVKDKYGNPAGSSRHDDLFRNLIYYMMTVLTQAVLGCDNVSYSEGDFFNTLADIEKTLGLPKNEFRYTLIYGGYEELLKARHDMQNYSDKDIEKYFKAYRDLLYDIGVSLAYSIICPSYFHGDEYMKYMERITVGDVRKVIKILKNSLQKAMNTKEIRSIMHHCKKLSDDIAGHLPDKRKLRKMIPDPHSREFKRG